MNDRRRFTLTPATAIALVALFFALGGSAFAVGERIQGASALQKTCTNGAVRGIANVTGVPSQGIANMPDQFSSAANLFSRRFNCTGKGVQVRRVAAGVYEVRFVGSTSTSAVGSAVGDAYANVETVSAGTFRVTIHPAGRDDKSDLAFTIVAV